MKSAQTHLARRLAHCWILLSLSFALPVHSETLWSDNFSDGNFTSDPAWNVPWGEVSVVSFGGSQVMDNHAQPMGFSGRIYAGLPDVGFGGTDIFTLEFDVYPRETLTDANNVRIQVWNWESYDCFELMENSNDNLQLRSNGTTVAQVALNGFPDRWHHILMARASTGFWTVIWDLGGSNQTVIQGQDPWGGPTSTLLPVLQIQCDGNYSAVNGAYFDNLEMWSSGLLVWHDDFEDGNYTADPAWNIPWGQVSIVSLDGDYVMDNRASPDPPGFSGRIYVPLPDVGYGGLDAFKLECDVHPRKTLSSANNVRIQIWNWETYDYFELMENDNDNLQIRINGVTVAQEPLNGFPDRWHHIVMQTDSTGYWTVVWDEGGSNQTTLEAQGPWGSAQNTLVPVLQLQCDGYYSNVNGAYFDNFVMSTLEGSYPGEFAVDEHTAGLWHFNENFGTIAHDATDNGYDMTLMDGAGWHAPGWNNTPSAVDLTDPDGKISSDYTMGNGWTALTIDAHIYATAINDDEHPIVCRTDFYNIDEVSYYFHVRENGSIAGGVWLNEVGTESAEAISAPGMIQIGQWYDVAMTWSSGQPVRIFVNNMTIPAVTGAESPTGSIRTSDDPLLIGCNLYQIYGWFYWQGYIDEVRISDIDRYPTQGGQIPPVLWTHAYGAEGDDYIYCVQQTKPDHGFVSVGAKTLSGSGTQLWAFKTDPNGNVQWEHTWGGTYNDLALWVEQTEDGGYIIIGSWKYTNTDYDAYLIKLDANGNTQWEHNYGGAGDGDDGTCVQQTSDGGYIFAGGTYSYGVIWDFWLVKVDAMGTLQWHRPYPMGGYQAASFVRQTSDGGYVMSGYTTPYYPMPWDAYIIKTDPSGNIQWTNQFGGSGGEYASCVRQLPGGDYVVTGFTDSYGAGGTDGLIYQLDNSGTLLWRKTYGGSADDEFRKFEITADGGFAIVGTDASSSTSNDFWLVKTDPQGNLLWDAKYGGTDDDLGWCLDLTDDGGLVLGGPTQSYGAGGWDGWLVRLGPAGPPPPPPPPVQIALTPINPPIIIPQNGGSFSYNAVIQNESGASQIFDVWCTVQVPGGSQFTVLGPIGLTLNAGASLTRLRTQGVPASAPGGEYAYWGFVGDYPWNVTSSDHFPFVKQGGDGDWIGADGWICSGEPFPGEIATVDQPPKEFALHGAFPNPFNPTTAISYQLSADSHVDLRVYDTAGRLVATLANGWGEAGAHRAVFDGSNLPSGIYIYRLQAGNFKAGGKMVLVK